MYARRSPRLSLAAVLRLAVAGCALVALIARPPSLRAEGAQAPAAPAPSKQPPAGAKQQRPANRLAKETSPYLLLHAHNPVDWYPWGEEAFAKARDEKKLIFLSIGYSSCYWCHVMERESFMDEVVAAAMNERFVCIKVDREERPDVDHIYMSALSVLGRQGGWPLTMILTPDALPIVGGTYFPPRDKEIELPKTKTAPDGTKQRITGLLTFLKLVDDAWRKNPQEVKDYAQQVAAAVQRGLRRRVMVAATPAADTAAKTVAALAEQFDAEYGGFGYSEANPRRPKFPEPSNLLFLLRYAGSHAADAEAEKPPRKMLSLSLNRMAGGGIRDHLGGGFHRYSTDRYWRVPHFEKMLYDNAQLTSVYAAAYKLTGEAEYRRVAEEILGFVERELTSPEGAFYAALDAETDGDEGQFYVWTREQLAAALSADEARLLGLVYGTAGEANFEQRYILEITRPVDEVAAAEGIAADALRQRLDAIRGKLLAQRATRDRPLTDTKILTAWNGLMIRGFADAGRLFDEPRYVQTAARAADFVLAKLRTPEGRLLRSYAEGQGRLNAYLDDYAFLVDGLLALHEVTREPRWLTAADELTAKQIELFWDEEEGGFFFTSDDHEELLARSKDPVDGALPSGNAVAAGNLVYLGRALPRPQLLERAGQTIDCFAALMNESPTAMPRMVLSWTRLSEARGPLGDEDKANPKQSEN